MKKKKTIEKVNTNQNLLSKQKSEIPLQKRLMKIIYIIDYEKYEQ